MSQINTLYSSFKELENQVAEKGRFTVIAIDGLAHKLGISQEGFPKFFVRTNSFASSIQNIIREILSIEYNVSCKLIDDAGHTEDDTFCIITLRSLDAPLQVYFVEIFTMMLLKLQPIPSNRELSVEIENLIAIFDALTSPPKKKIQGLWAELLVIDQSTRPEVLINAWHSSPSAKYDFTLGRDKIEVKSTSSEERVHKFSLDQLNPSPNSRLLIASTVVRESGKAAEGLSVRELYEKIRNKVPAVDSQLRLYTIIAETIGSDIAKLESIFYDYTAAVDFLEFYDYHDIPSISKDNVPRLVSEVIFSSNLNGLIDVRSNDSPFEMNSSNLFNSLI